MSIVKTWLEAFRLRTLPLSFALVLTGSAIALQNDCFSTTIFALELTTTLFLQILSNLSNDYGDTVHGVDNAQRKGPTRAVQSGAISPAAMRRAILVFSLLSLVAGISLLVVSLPTIGMYGLATLFVIGLLCIAAAITYTCGKHAYGYVGFGDLSVFIFFGIVGVCGCFYLHSGTLLPQSFLLASAIGLLSVGVLNMNNIRDMESDLVAGKRSIPIIIGRKCAKIYHSIVIVSAITIISIYIAIWGSSIQSISLLATTPLIINAIRTHTNDTHSFFDSQLKIISISTFLFSTLFILTSR